jgi:hypothetical protein
VILLVATICMHIINLNPAVAHHCPDNRVGEIGVSSVVAGGLAYGVVKSDSARKLQALETVLAPLAMPASTPRSGCGKPEPGSPDPPEQIGTGWIEAGLATPPTQPDAAR